VQANKYIQLTIRERDVCQLVIKGFQTKEIGSRLNITDRTVEFHKQNIYHKFGVSDALNLVKAALASENNKNYDLGEVKNIVIRSL
jgi:DNA-binding NarL/FixJ family response regulator